MLKMVMPRYDFRKNRPTLVRRPKTVILSPASVSIDFTRLIEETFSIDKVWDPMLRLSACAADLQYRP